MEQKEKILDRTLSHTLQDRTNALVENIEMLINDYESETGLSVDDAKIRYNEHFNTKEVRLLINYYNFDNTLIDTGD